MVTKLSEDFENISSPRLVGALWEMTGDLRCTGDFGGIGLTLEPYDHKKKKKQTTRAKSTLADPCPPHRTTASELCKARQAF